MIDIITSVLPRPEEFLKKKNLIECIDIDNTFLQSNFCCQHVGLKCYF